MNKKLLLAALPTALILSGCMSLAPDHSKVEGVVPTEFGSDGIYAKNEVGQVVSEDLLWSNYIQNVKMKEIVQAALDNNKDLKIAVANIEAAKAQYGVSQTDRFPMIGGDINGTRAKNLSGQTGISESYQASLGLSAFEIDIFGRVKNLSDAALNSFLSTQEAKKVTQLLIISETSNAYYNVALAKSQLAIAEKTKQATKESLDIMKLRVEHGISAAKDQKDLESLYFLSQSDVVNYETQVAQSINALRFLVGTNIDMSLMPENIGELEKSIKDIQVGLDSSVLFNRPDVLAAEYQLKGANANIGAARAAFFPRISLTTSIGVASGELSNLFSNNVGTWSFMPTIHIPIFEVAKNKANLKYSEAQRDKMLATYEKTVQQAFKEVNDTLARKSTMNEQISYFDKYVQTNKDRLDLATKTYEAGVKDYLSVLTARTDLYNAEKSAILLEKERFSNLVMLYKVLGS